MSGTKKPNPRKRFEDEERGAPDIIPMHYPIMREMAEPKDGFEPTPVWLMLIYFALAGWGGYYLASNAGEFRSDIFTEDPRQSATASSQSATAPAPDPLVLGKRLYSRCSTCHQPDGVGVSGVYPPLAGSDWVTGSEEVLVRILLHGLNGPLTVTGETYAGEMPAWNQLNDEQIGALLTYIRASWGNSAEAVAPDTVRAIREAENGRTRHWTQAELLEIAPTGTAADTGARR